MRDPVQTFVLSDWQVATLLALGGLPDPAPGTPLRVVRDFPRPLAPGEPGWDALTARGLVVPDGDAWRVNLAIRGVLAACVRPDEVIDVGVSDPAIPGFSIVRRGPIVAECTVAADGTTKLAFPLTRTAAIVTLVGAVSGDRPEPPPTGFRFRGGAGEAFVLAAALRALREDPVPLTAARVRGAVARDLGIRGYVLPFAIAAGPEHTDALRGPDGVDAAIARLVDGGHLEQGPAGLAPSAAVREALAGDPAAVVGIGRTEFADGRPAHTAMTATRVGERILLFRVVSPAGEPVAFEWAEVDRATLRWLVFGMCLTQEELRLLEAGREAGGDAAPEAAPIQTTTWQPTHDVRAEGGWAYEAPDPARGPVAPLDPALPVVVDQVWGGWAHIVCENGWRAWVATRDLVARR